MSKEFPIYLQQDAQDCGISCLRMICKFYGKTYSAEHLKSIIIPRADGISLLEISEGAEQLGFKSFAARITFDQLKEKVPLPCMVHWDKNHNVVVYKINNIVIPRDAHQQAELGEGYSFVEEAEPGDLAFFDNEDGKITHVGILISKNKIIHASGKVRIDTLDHQGIYNNETNSYSHRLRIIKNLI